MKQLPFPGDLTARFPSPDSEWARKSPWTARVRLPSPAPEISSLLKQISQTLSLSAWDAEKLRSIGGEKDPRMLALQLLALGREWKGRQEEEKAGFVFQALVREGIPPEIQGSAKRELEAMAGQGSFGMRFEYLGSRFVRDSANYKVIVPMLLGTAAFGAVRAASYSRLLGGTGFFSRGLGLNFGSALMGSLAEIPIFALSGRMLHRWAGDPVRGSVGEDLASAGITLSFLKMFSLAGKKVWGPAGIRRSGSAILSTGISQFSTFLGLWAAHGTEIALGLRQSTDRATTVTDTLASMVSLKVGARLGQAVLGPRYAAFQREMEFRSAGMETKGNYPSPWPAPSPKRLGRVGDSPPRGEGMWMSASSPLVVEGAGRVGSPLSSTWKMVSRSGTDGGASQISRSLIPIQIDFEISKNPTEEEIGKIVKAIVAQDSEFYPEGDASVMNTSRKHFLDRRYQSGDREFTLGTLAGWVRRAKGLKAGDIKSLLNSQILKDWKKNLFGIEEKEVGRSLIPLQLDFSLSDSPTEEEIGKIVQAMVAQDSEFYPEGNASLMSASKKYFTDRWYQSGGREFVLGTLAGWVRRARGMKTKDTKALPTSQILREWKAGLFGIEEKEMERSLIPLQLDFSLSDSLTEEEIGKIVQAIVAQDSEFYPNGHASVMNAGPKYFIERWYGVGDREFTLERLTSWVRMARGFKAGDIKSLLKTQILKEWKKGLFGIEEKEVGRSLIPLQLDFPISDSPTEEEIGKIVQAIVAQDREFYPEGDGSTMSASPKYFRNRWYQSGGRELTLRTLAGWARQARGLKAGDSKALMDGQILVEWKKDVFGIDPELSGIPLQLDFSLSDSPTEKEIGKIVQAIVAQDSEFYPNGNASVMNASVKYRRYQSGGREFTLETLAGWSRRARGLKAGDTKILPTGQILREWKKNLFGIEEKEKERSLIPLQLDFSVSNSSTEEEIGKIVKAIVAQDSEFYPNGNASVMNTGPKYFSDRWYQSGGREFTFQTLAGWVRRARGLKRNDAKTLPRTQIIKEWKKGLFGIEEKEVERNLISLHLDFSISASPTEEEIGKIVQAFVAQDSEFYPDGNASVMNTSVKYFKDRWYQGGGREFTLSTLAGWVRRARGLKAGDTKTLPTSQILREWKGGLFGIVDFHRFSSSKIEAFLRTHSREELVHLFSEDPWILAEVLSFLKKGEFQDMEQMKTILNDLREVQLPP